MAWLLIAAPLLLLAEGTRAATPCPVPRVPCPALQAPSPEPRVPSPGSSVPSPESRVPNPEVVRYEASHEAMGTIYTVVAYGRDKTSLSEAVGQAFEEIDQLDDQMSNYKPESELSGIDRDAAQRELTVAPELFNLIQYSMHASEESGGDFDIDRKSTRLNSSHANISYAVFCLKK